MSKVIKQSSCPNCGSSDANTLYEDGHWYCFSCQHYTPPERNEMDITKPAPIQGVVQTNFTKGERGGLDDRRISNTTANKFNVEVKRNVEGEIVQHIY